MKILYPDSFASIGMWAKTHKVSVGEARARFAQYCILKGIASSNRLSSVLVFKGGNALDFVWQPNRSTKDLDFSALDSELTTDLLRPLLNEALQQTGRLMGVAFIVQRFERQPPGENRTFVTYEVKIGYALSDDSANMRKIQEGKPSVAVIPLDISMNEQICAHQAIDINANNPLLVSTLEDIVAEKLRALLQQVTRNRNRRQDLLDIAVLVRQQHALNLDSVSLFLIKKSESRQVTATKSAFKNPEVAQRASLDYDAQASTTRELFVPLSEAIQLLLDLVEKLAIPD